MFDQKLKYELKKTMSEMKEMSELKRLESSMNGRQRIRDLELKF